MPLIVNGVNIENVNVNGSPIERVVVNGVEVWTSTQAVSDETPIDEVAEI